MIHATCCAHATRLWALLHHRHRVELTFVVVRPDVTLCLVFVCTNRALTHTTGVWACL